MSESSRALVYAVSVIALVAVAFLFAAKSNSSMVQASNAAAAMVAPAATFAGSGVGAIPDGGSACSPSPGAARDVTFAATGLSGSVSDVSISASFGSPNHTWMGDIVATLIAPNGASHIVFGRTGATSTTSAGDSSDLGGTYTFSDTAPSPPSGGWWQESTVRGAAEAMTIGTYRTTQLGGAGTPNPAPATNMNPAFTGVSNANGTWTLRLTDGCIADTGSITAATLNVTTGILTPADANVDMNGDGKTDYVVARGTNTPLADGATANLLSPAPYDDPDVRRTPGARKAIGTEGESNLIAPPIYWYVSINGSGTTGVGQLGDAATDFLTPEDFDGDGKDDLAVWTLGAAGSANFKIFQSTTNTVRVEIFGQSGDDPAVVGDYDGDNKADPAVYRCPPDTGADGQCYFFFRGSNANPAGNITYVPWGFGIDGDFFPLIGDFDGDGKYDFCIQRANPASPTNGQFVLLKSNGLGVEYINWGLSSDFLIPGDYDADGKADICVRRSNSPTAGARTYFILYRTGATSQTQWGIVGDASTPGDYDGDGKTDLAIWRGNADPNQNFFWVLNSSNGSVTNFEWGQCPTVNTCDFAVAGWAVH